MKMTISILLIALTVLAFNSVALAAPSAGAVVADLLVLRPLGFAGTVLGGAAFVVSLPVTLATHKVQPVEETLVERPFDYTFERPLGQM
jgi:hypothetical protein